MGQPRKAPLHLPIAVGVTTGLYAISLAGVAALQAQTDAATAGAQRPMSDALAGVSAQRASVERQLDGATANLNRATELYNAALGQATTFHQSLTDLAAQVAAVTGAAAQVPSRLSLPSALRPVGSVATAPAVHATTGASGKP